MLPLKQYVKNPRLFLFAIFSRIGFLFPDKKYVQISYYLKIGKRLNLDCPRSYNEKLQWLKLYDRRPEYTIMVDKYSVKDFVASIIGKEYIIPTLGIYSSPEDIEWDKLPNQFVLKTTHGGGSNGVLICKDKSTFDIASATYKLSCSMKKDIYQSLREWPYKNIKRRILAEAYIAPNGNSDLPDYKFFCFDGVVKALFVGTERGTGDVKFDYFDADFNHLDLVQVHPMAGKKLEKPNNFDEMKRIAARLSEGLPHVRVDLYNVDGKIYFGELTFYHHGGIVPFYPEKWDYEFGSWLQLPHV